jgi:hypothetical protein
MKNEDPIYEDPYKVEFLVKLSNGTLSEIWLGRIEETDNWQTKYAVIKASKDDTAKIHLFNQYQVMKIIGKDQNNEYHPNIIKYIEFISDVSRHFNEKMKIEIQSFLAFEFAPNRSLVEYVIYQRVLVEEK